MNLSPNMVLCNERGVKRTAGERHVLEVLNKGLQNGSLAGWAVYEQPHLNGDRPDFVLMHPEKGIVLIEVKDWDITSSNYKPVSLFHDGHRWIKKQNPADQLQKYHSNILEMYASKYVPLLEHYGDVAYGVIENAVYFHNASADVAADFCGKGKKEYQYLKILDRYPFTG